MKELRLIFDPPSSGAWNMAVDEALLETAASSRLGTLRFYTWEEPTLSLGYFQSAADRSQHSASLNCPLVRRASGGGAILHDRELTYSIALPQREARPGAANELYDAVHESLAETLGELGIAASLFRTTSAQCGTGRHLEKESFLCFQRRTCGDVICNGAKIAGSAQRRRRGAVLQHGSVLLARSLAAPELPGIAELTGRHFAAVEVANRWNGRLLQKLASSATQESLTFPERERAESLVNVRFGSPEFASRR